MNRHNKNKNDNALFKKIFLLKFEFIFLLSDNNNKFKYNSKNS